MAQNSILLDKSLLFAARIVKLNKYLTKEKKETMIAKQILRSATSIGANANEAVYGISKADFIAKIDIYHEYPDFGYSINWNLKVSNGVVISSAMK